MDQRSLERLGHHVVSRRVALGYRNRTDLADSLAFTVRTLADIEHGVRKASPGTYAMLENKLAWSPGTRRYRPNNRGMARLVGTAVNSVVGACWSTCLRCRAITPAPTMRKSRMSSTFMSVLLAVVTLDPDTTPTSAAAGRRVRQDMPDAETDTSSAASAPRFEPDEGWVPADQRLFGVDRRTIGPTLTVFALAIVMSVVLPVTNAKVAYDDIVTAGDVVELEGDVTFVPEAGWGITSGVRAGDAPLSREYPSTATVEDGEVNFTVHTAPFDGDANKLLDQIETTSDALNRGRGVHATGERTTIVTAQGKPGTTARVTGPQTGGVIAAFVFDGRGVEAVATGPSDTGPDTTAAILRMIRTISYPGGGKQ